jgi:hypothetical protein
MFVHAVRSTCSGLKSTRLSLFNVMTDLVVYSFLASSCRAKQESAVDTPEVKAFLVWLLGSDNDNAFYVHYDCSYELF